MKSLLILASLLIAGSVLAESTSSPEAWPMPSPFPTAPKGTPDTSFPLPRLDWFERVNRNITDAAKKGDSIQLIFDGDSITDSWPRTGAPIWNERYAPYGAYDFGISADRTQHLLWRLSQGQAKGLKPKLIALMIGTNNTNLNTAEDIAEGVKTIVRKYQEICPDAVILLQGIFPRGKLPTDPSRIKIAAVNEIISKLGDDKKVIYLDFGSKFLNPDGTMSPEVMPDFLHPSLQGYQIWADAIQPVIDKYFPPLAPAATPAPAAKP